MSANAGVLRSGTGLTEAAAGLSDLARLGCDKPAADAWQATNLQLVAAALVRAGAGTRRRLAAVTGVTISASRARHGEGIWSVRSASRAADGLRAGARWLTTLNARIGRPAEQRAGLDPALVASLAAAALAEDLAGGSRRDAPRATVPAAARGRGDLVARTPGVVAGLPVAEAVFALASADLDCTELAADGDRVAAGQPVLSVTGPIRAILTAERTALNLLCHLSGVATLTRRWADAVAGTPAAIRDTRKTTPGMRALEKYAVRCGGGVNHRMSLSDAALIKDNHVAAAGSVPRAFAAVRAQAPGLPLEVECDTLEQVSEALAAGADLILLDNFTATDMAAAVRLAGGRALLEASGGLTLLSARAVAETGVDYLAVGALTHSAPALDIGLDLVPAWRAIGSEMLLTIDVGNTNTVLGVFDGTDVVEHWRISTDPVRTADELAVLLQGLLRQSTLLREPDVSGIALCSTVPSVLHELREMCRRYYGDVPAVIVEPGVKTGRAAAI